MGNKNGETSATATTVAYASQSTINSQLQIMISYIFILMSTRTEPYRNSILAKKKKRRRRRNKNQTKTKQKTYKIDFGLIVAQAAVVHFLFPDLNPFGQRHGSIRGSGQTDRTWPVHSPVSLQEKSGRETDFFRGKGGVCTHLDRSLPVQFLQSFFNIFKINIFKFQYFTLYQFQIASLK